MAMSLNKSMSMAALHAPCTTRHSEISSKKIYVPMGRRCAPMNAARVHELGPWRYPSSRGKPDGNATDVPVLFSYEQAARMATARGLMTLGNMRSLGPRDLDVTCEACGHRTIVNVDAYPDDAEVPFVRASYALQQMWPTRRQCAAGLETAARHAGKSAAVAAIVADATARV